MCADGGERSSLIGSENKGRKEGGRKAWRKKKGEEMAEEREVDLLRPWMLM